MDDNYDSTGILDIVRGLQDIDVDITAPMLDRDIQGGENVQLGE